MSDNTAGGVYCSVCHKRRPASHFEDRPEHAPGGPKFTLAERREMLDAGGDLDGYSSTPRPRRVSSSTPQTEGNGWGGLAIAGGVVAAFVGLMLWIGRNMPPAA